MHGAIAERRRGRGEKKNLHRKGAKTAKNTTKILR
jgi:hypothetical protein